MNIPVVQLIKLGQKYLSLWPEKPEFSQYFEDYWAVQSARFVCRYFPALAIFTVIIQLYVASGYPLGQGSVNNALNALPQALLYGAFLLSIPVQALVFSGVKADTFLPPSLASWYLSGLNKMRQQVEQNSLDNYQDNVSESNNNIIESLTRYKPRYIDLAQLLQLSYSTTK